MTPVRPFASSAPKAQVGRSVPAGLASFFASEQELRSPVDPQIAAQTKPQLALLAFWIGREVYALPMLDVLEVVILAHLTRVPQLGPASLGIMSFRGNIVPVVDLAAILKMGAADSQPQACRHVVILRDPQAPLGLAVLRVLGVVRLTHDQLEPAHGSGSSLVRGIGHGSQGLVRVIDAPDLSRQLERMP